VLSVVPDTRVVAGLGESRLVEEEMRHGYQASLDAIVATAPEGVETTGRLLPGPVVDGLSDLSLRGLRRAGLRVPRLRTGRCAGCCSGSVSSRVVRHSKVPVISTPRGD
jgi:hypothetical protein